MTKSRKARYKLAVYLFLGALAVILGLVALNYYTETDPTRAVLLNLSTELAGVVLIFLIVDQIFLLRAEDDLLAEIRSLKTEVRNKFNPLMSAEEARKSFQLEQYLSDAESVDLMGYTLSSLLKEFRESIAEAAIHREVEVRILLVDITSEAGAIMRNHSNKPHMIEREGKAGLDFARDIKRKLEASDEVRGSVVVKLTSWIPSCNMIVVNREQVDGVAKIGVNPISYRQPVRGRKFLVLRRSEHMQDFTYFVEQFNALWNDDAEELPA